MTASPLSRLADLLASGGPRHRTATGYVEDVLRRAILEGHLAGGTALRQEELADLFGMSRMPIREALRQLEAQALIDFVPHKGAVVTEISAADAADTYAIRLALEPVALAQSIPRLTAEDFERAEDLISEMDLEPDTARLGELNRRFHMSLYAGAGGPKLLAIVEAQLAAFDRYLRFHLSAFGREHMSQDEHRAMLAAARRGDVAEAEAVLRTHIRTAAQAMERFFAERA